MRFLWFVSHYKQFRDQRELRKKKSTEDVKLLTQRRELKVAALWNGGGLHFWSCAEEISTDQVTDPFSNE